MMYSLVAGRMQDVKDSLKVEYFPLATYPPGCFQMEYERQVASVRAKSAIEGDFSVSQAEMSSRQAMLENASDIKVTLLTLYVECVGRGFTKEK